MQARKEQLAAAVWDTIVEKGIGAVSVRTVAEAAGVAVGSLRHVFPTRAELIEFSARLMIDKVSDRVAGLQRTGDERTDVVAILSQFLPLDAQRRAELEVNLALIAETPALPELQGIRDDATRALRAACVRLAERVRGNAVSFEDALAGQGDQRRGATLHALVDGLALHLLVDPAAEEEALAIVRAQIDTLAET
ncbi:MAG: TetR family transcriptional regulator [Kocuria sp.]|nr:TetR family transcriptional regulator [Kocuria sp.]